MDERWKKISFRSINLQIYSLVIRWIAPSNQSQDIDYIENKKGSEEVLITSNDNQTQNAAHYIYSVVGGLSVSFGRCIIYLVETRMNVI